MGPQYLQQEADDLHPGVPDCIHERAPAWTWTERERKNGDGTQLGTCGHFTSLGSNFFPYQNAIFAFSI